MYVCILQLQTFGKVKDVLKPWPHLLKIFSDFLQPQEATKAKVVSSQYFWLIRTLYAVL